MTDKVITISLPESDLAQMLDALFVRRDDWRYTQRYLEEGYEEPERIIEDCKGPEEAREIADHYDRIIEKIQPLLH